MGFVVRQAWVPEALLIGEATDFFNEPMYNAGDE